MAPPTRMLHDKTTQQDQGSPSILSPLLVALIIYALAFTLLLLWLLLVVIDDTSAYKAFVFGPMLGSIHLVHVLTFMNVTWLVLLLFPLRAAWQRTQHPRWKAIATPLLGLALVIGIQLGVQGLASSASKYDNDLIRSDPEMIEVFEEYKAWFDKVVTEIQAELAGRKVEPPVSLWRLETDPVGWYSGRLGELGMHRSIEKSADDDSLWFTTSVHAIGERGTFKGFVYSQTPPSPLATSLDAVQTDGDKLEVYREIGDHWYLFLRIR